MAVQIEGINIRDIRKNITAFLEAGAVDSRVIDELLHEALFVPKECELWDYKRETAKDIISLAETVLEVVSFYNTYGGYIIYGVEEYKDKNEFVPIGIIRGSLAQQQLEQYIRNYTGEEIDISYLEITRTIGEGDYLFGLLYVQERPQTKAPASFGKNGPERKKGELIFHKDDVYFRSQDRCISAKTKEDFQMLIGERRNPFLWDSNDPISGRQRRNIIVDQNLPDRNIICSRFIGRDDIIQDLWRWLGDDLAKTRVLAGDGGKGKTSIAYEFAEEVCRTKPYGIEKVVWLTAKTKQFIGSLNHFVETPQTNYSDVDTHGQARGTL